jgi:hypothetical protein
MAIRHPQKPTDKSYVAAVAGGSRKMWSTSGMRSKCLSHDASGQPRAFAVAAIQSALDGGVWLVLI